MCLSSWHWLCASCQCGPATAHGLTAGFILTEMYVNYTPPQKKRNTCFRSPHDPSLGSATPRGQKVISRGSFPNFDLWLEIEETTPFDNLTTKLGSWELLNQALQMRFVGFKFFNEQLLLPTPDKLHAPGLCLKGIRLQMSFFHVSASTCKNEIEFHILLSTLTHCQETIHFDSKDHEYIYI